MSHEDAAAATPPAPQRGVLAKLRAVLGLLFVLGVGFGGFLASRHLLTKRPTAPEAPPVAAVEPAPEPDSDAVVDLTQDIPTVPASADGEATPEIEPAQQKIGIVLMQGDSRLAEANPSAALRKYAAILPEAKGAARIPIEFRMALAEEGIGERSSALKRYRGLAGASDATLAAAARLGQARLWQAQERSDLAESILVELLLNEAAAGMNPGLRSDVVHLLGTVAASIAIPSAPDRILDDRELVLPSLSRPLMHLLEDAQSPEIVPSVSAPEGIELRIGDAGAPPEEIELSVRMPRRPVIEILAEMARTCGYRVRGTREMQQRLASRSMPVHAPRLSAAVLLDGILAGDGLQWECHDRELRIVTPEHDSPAETEYAKRRAKRYLEHALTAAPDHPWAPAAYIALARIASASGEEATAERHLEQVMRVYPRSDFDGYAAFNLGKIRMGQGELDEARSAFLHCVDGSHGQRLEPAGYLYAGRIALELGQPRRAIPPLTRAIALRGEPRVTREGSLLLSAAYLLGGNPVSANTTLLDRKGDLSDSSARDVAAFLSCFSQFRLAEHDDARRTRDGRALLNSLEHATKGPHFGLAVPLLLAQAAAELNLDEEARRHYESIADSAYPAPVRSASLYALASLHWSAGERDKALALLDGLIESSSDDWKRHGSILRCGYWLDESVGQQSRVIDEAQKLLGEQLTPEERNAVLRLMGRALQNAGRNDLAAYCFAGVSPVDLLKSSREAHP